MKKQFAAVFAATALLGVTSAFAANPFSDVTPDSWAYQAVSQLAAANAVVTPKTAVAAKIAANCFFIVEFLLSEK